MLLHEIQTQNTLIFSQGLTCSLLFNLSLCRWIYSSVGSVTSVGARKAQRLPISHLSPCYSHACHDAVILPGQE